ncbi:MAG: hypothetical protein ACLUVB_04735 [Acutalibacteraceae bacterium]
MKINATFDREGYLENFATLGTVDGGMDVETPEDVSEDELMENYAAYRLENGALVLDEAKLAAMQAAAEQAALTARYIPSEAQSAAEAGRLVLAQMAGLETMRASAFRGCTSCGSLASTRPATSAIPAGRRGNASKRTTARCIRTSSPAPMRGSRSGGPCTGNRRRRQGCSCLCRARTTCTKSGNMRCLKMRFTSARRTRPTARRTTRRRGKN